MQEMSNSAIKARNILIGLLIFSLPAIVVGLNFIVVDLIFSSSSDSAKFALEIFTFIFIIFAIIKLIQGYSWAYFTILISSFIGTAHQILYEIVFKGLETIYMLNKANISLLDYFEKEPSVVYILIGVTIYWITTLLLPLYLLRSKELDLYLSAKQNVINGSVE